MELTNILLIVLIFLIFLNFIILIFLSVFLVRMKDFIQSNMDSLNVLKPQIQELYRKAGIESWDKKYETELEKLNQRLKSGSNLDDL